jgi:hypothetical protein
MYGQVEKIIGHAPNYNLEIILVNPTNLAYFNGQIFVPNLPDVIY